MIYESLQESLAQLVEHLNRNQRVEGSNPLAGIANLRK